MKLKIFAKKLTKITRNYFCLKNNNKKIIKKETINLNQADEAFKKIIADKGKLNHKQESLPKKIEKTTDFNDSVIPEMVNEEDNYCSIYYTLQINKSFDLFDLRDFFFSFMYAKQRKGHIYINLLDTKFKGVIKYKNR